MTPCNHGLLSSVYMDPCSNHQRSSFEQTSSIQAPKWCLFFVCRVYLFAYAFQQLESTHGWSQSRQRSKSAVCQPLRPDLFSKSFFFRHMTEISWKALVIGLNFGYIFRRCTCGRKTGENTRGNTTGPITRPACKASVTNGQFGTRVIGYFMAGSLFNLTEIFPGQQHQQRAKKCPE